MKDIMNLSPTPSDDIYVVIKSLLASRVNSTLAELLRDYDDKVGDNRLPRNFKDLRRLLQSTPEVECMQNDYGLEMWQVKKSNKKPEYKYMKKNKPRVTSKRPRRSSKQYNSASSSQANSSSSTQPKPKRKRYDPPQQLKDRDINHNVSKCHQIIDLDGYFHNYQLMGDDFLLSMAKIDLGFKYTKDPTTAILRIGFCISGLTIKDLARILRSSVQVNTRVIVYIGTVDILNGRTTEQLISDYFDLMSAFRERGIEPNVCTLAPIADESRQYDVKVNSFNCWLTHRNWSVIDLNKCFIDGQGHVIQSFFQKDPRNVTGCNLRHLLWNKLGRRRVLKELKRYTLGPNFNF